MKNRISGFYWISYYGTWLVGEWDSDGGYWLLPGIIMTSWDEDFSEIIETPLFTPHKQHP